MSHRSKLITHYFSFMTNSPLNQLRKELERPLAHPDWATTEKMGVEAIRWLIRHHSTLSDQVIGRTGTRKQMEELLREPAYCGWRRCASLPVYAS
jgi:hypothetical protein